jgi:hypothetical protein
VTIDILFILNIILTVLNALGLLDFLATTFRQASYLFILSLSTLEIPNNFRECLR